MTPFQLKLLHLELLSEGDLRDAKEHAAREGGTFPLSLVRLDLLGEEQILDVLNQDLDVPAVLQFEMEDIPASVVTRVPWKLAEKYRVVPIEREGETLTVVMSDPTDHSALAKLADAAGLEIRPRAATESVISWALLKYYEIITPVVNPPEPEPETAPATARDGGEALDLVVVLDGEDKTLPPLDAVRTDEEPSGDEADDEDEKERISFPVSIDIEGDDLEGPEMGDWDAPFELRDSIEDDAKPDTDRDTRSRMTTRRDIPEDIEDVVAETASTGEGAPEGDEEEKETPLLLVEEEDWESAGAALEDAIEADAVTTDEPILEDEAERPSTVTVMRNVLVSTTEDADIIPPQPLTKRKAVAGIHSHMGSRPPAEEEKEAVDASHEEETVPSGGMERPPKTRESTKLDGAASSTPKRIPAPLRPLGSKPPRLSRKPESKAPAPADETPASVQDAPAPAQRHSIDPALVERWREALQSLESRDEVLDATLAFFQDLFGPSLFLARKGKNLGGWSGSGQMTEALGGSVQDVLIVPPSPREVWHALERKRGMMGPIAKPSEYPFLAPWSELGPVAILVLPVVIKGIAAGAFLCVLRDVWSASPSLRDALETAGRVLSEKLESIVKKRKQAR